ncbi:MAG: hypothetical protein GYA55_06075, partial [SAR324 cluster bacterium]|nr:hypothetical protein [SAR324 cluster bacterium]
MTPAELISRYAVNSPSTLIRMPNSLAYSQIASYGAPSSSNIASTIPSSFSASSSLTTNAFQQIVSIVSEVARRVVESVLSYLAPYLGLGSANLNRQTSSDLSNIYNYGSSLSGNDFVQYAAAKIKNPKNFYEKIINWFSYAGDLGHDISNGLSDARAVVSPFTDALSSIWDKGSS